MDGVEEGIGLGGQIAFKDSLALDQAAISVSRDTTYLQAAWQVNAAVRPQNAWCSLAVLPMQQELSDSGLMSTAPSRDKNFWNSASSKAKRQLRRILMKCQHCNRTMLQGSIRVSPGQLGENQCEFFPDERDKEFVPLSLPSTACRCVRCQMTELHGSADSLVRRCPQCRADMLDGVVELQFSLGAAAANLPLGLVGLGTTEWCFCFNSEAGSTVLDSKTPAFFCTACKIGLLVAVLTDSLESIKCLVCSKDIPPGMAACPDCGWTWAETEFRA